MSRVGRECGVKIQLEQVNHSGMKLLSFVLIPVAPPYSLSGPTLADSVSSERQLKVPYMFRKVGAPGVHIVPAI